MARILVIEDEIDLQTLVIYNLRQVGHEVLAASDAEQGLKAAREQRPQLVLLDLMLPDGSGTDVCRALKQDAATRHIPVMMVTAKGEEIDRVLGFELGADDYVVKPFSIRELILRIQVVLKRGRAEAAPTAVVSVGGLTIDRDAHRVWVETREVDLTALEFKLIVTLYDRRNRVQTRSALLEDVWGMSADVSTRTVDTHVKRLREKLGAASELIETVRGVGYRFTEPA